MESSESFEEYWKDFERCGKCYGLIHWKHSPCLTPSELAEAMTFPVYYVGCHAYVESRQVMENVMKYNQERR